MRCWFNAIKSIAKEIISNKRLGLIWRPHPLLPATIGSMRPSYLSEYEALLQLIHGSDNAVLDTTADFRCAYKHSDALISDGGSLTYMYYALKKPVLNLLMPPNIKNTHIMVFDHTLCYSGLAGYSRTMGEEDRNALIMRNTRNYIDLVLANATDERVEACYRALHEQTNNIGNSGSAIHHAILHELKNSLNQGQ